jgi:hypothetical protein
MTKEMFFMETYKSPKSGNTMLVFSDNKVSPKEVESVNKHNESVRTGSITVNFAGKAVQTYGSFKQVNSGDQVIVPLSGEYNFSPDELTKMRETTHSVIQGEPVEYSSGNKSTFRYLGKLS